MPSRLPAEGPARGNADRERSQPPMAGSHCFPVRPAGDGRPDRRLAGRWCGWKGTDPIIGSRDGSPHRKARLALPWLEGSAVAFSPDGRWFATGSHPETRYQASSNLGREHGPVAVSAVAERQLDRGTGIPSRWQGVAAGDYDGLVRFWDTSTGRELGRPLPQGEIVFSLAYSPDGTVLAVGLASDKPARPAFDSGIPGHANPSVNYCPALSPGSNSGRMVGPCSRLTLTHVETRLWDMTRGQAIGDPMVDEAPGGFRPDGRAFLTAGKDGTVRLRDATTGEVLAKLLTASSPATCAVFRRDGGLVAAGFEDGTVRLCDPVTAQPVGPPRSMRHLPFVRSHSRPMAGRSPPSTMSANRDLARSRAAPGFELGRVDATHRGPDRPPDGQGTGDFHAQ